MSNYPASRVVRNIRLYSYLVLTKQLDSTFCALSLDHQTRYILGYNHLQIKFSKLWLVLPVSRKRKFVKRTKKLLLQTQNPPVWLMLKNLSGSVLVSSDLEIYLTATRFGKYQSLAYTKPVNRIFLVRMTAHKIDNMASWFPEI